MNIRLSAAVMMVLALLSGCIGANKEKESATEDFAAPAVDFEYRLGEFDELEIKVWEGVEKQELLVDKSGAKEYLVSTGDILNIYVWQWNDLNRDVIVRPDGKLSFPLVGDLQASGKSLTQIDEEITLKLKEYIKYPEVSVMVKDYGKSGLDSKLVLNDLPQRLMIRPDGRFSFPFVGDIVAQGRTLREIDEELTGILSSYVYSPEVYINLAKIGGKKVLVLGEVRLPGVYRIAEQARLLDAIALAGGSTRDAALGSVLLIKGGLENPRPKVINVADIIKRGKLTSNELVGPEDIIYVPKTLISDVNYTVQQLVGPIVSTGTVWTNIKTIRERTTPFLNTGTAQ